MRIERVDDKTVKCFLSNDELAEYDLSYKDFLFRSEKAKEIVEEIVKQAIEEVGYQPPKYAFDLSVMMMPDQGMILTFSEKDVNLEELLNNPHLDALLGAFAKAAGEKIEAHKEAADEEAENQSAVETKTQKVEETAEKRGEQPTFAVFAFESIRDICQYAEALPSNLRVKSALYEMDGTYYLYLDKGTASYERYSRACIRAMEFGALYTAENKRVEYLKEHADCLIADHAVKKLRLQ